MGIERVEVVELPALVLTRARDFYGRVLGLQPSLVSGDGPGGTALFDLAGGETSVALHQPAVGEEVKPVIAFQVAGGTDIETLLREIEAAGGAIQRREISTPDLLKIGLTDTEGNAIELLVHH